jgi:hypothetical protein
VFVLLPQLVIWSDVANQVRLIFRFTTSQPSTQHAKTHYLPIPWFNVSPFASICLLTGDLFQFLSYKMTICLLLYFSSHTLWGPQLPIRLVGTGHDSNRLFRRLHLVEIGIACCVAHGWNGKIGNCTYHQSFLFLH